MIFWKIIFYGCLCCKQTNFLWRIQIICPKSTWHLGKKSTLDLFLGSKIDIIKFAIFSDFWGPQSNDGSRYRKIPWTCSLDYKSLLNFTCTTMKFHNHVHATRQFLSWTFIFLQTQCILTTIFICQIALREGAPVEFCIV